MHFDFRSCPHEVDQPFIGRHEWAPRIHYNDKSRERAALGNVSADEFGPGFANVFVCFRKAVARQVYQMADCFASAFRTFP